MSDLARRGPTPECRRRFHSVESAGRSAHIEGRTLLARASRLLSTSGSYCRRALPQINGIGLRVPAARGCAPLSPFARVQRARRYESSTRSRVDLDPSASSMGQVRDCTISRPNRADGVQEVWDVVSSNPARMASAGWTKDTIKLGDHITVSGGLGRNGTRRLALDLDSLRVLT